MARICMRTKIKLFDERAPTDRAGLPGSRARLRLLLIQVARHRPLAAVVPGHQSLAQATGRGSVAGIGRHLTVQQRLGSKLRT